MARRHRPVDGCDPETDDCELESISMGASWTHARVGVRVRVGKQRRFELGFDVGAWSGGRTDYASGEVESEATFATPMLGFSLLKLL